MGILHSWPLPATWVHQVLGVTGLLFVLGSLIYAVERFILSVPYPSNIRLIREAPGARRFSLRTRLAYYIDCKALFQEAWDKFLSKGQPVVLPGMGFRKEVILPPQHMRWVLAQSDDRLSVPEAMAELDQARWSLGHDTPITDPWQGMLVKTELNRVLESICAALNDELSVAFDAHFGTNTDAWRDIELRPTISKAIAQANSRFTVGLPLCRNPDYLDTVLALNDGLIAIGGVVSGLPRLLQPVLGTALGFYMQRQITKISKWLVPLWQERIALIRRADNKTESEGWNGSEDEPQDHVQIMARFALRERPHEVEDNAMIVRRICAQNFGAIHQTTIQVCNLLLDILGSDAQFNTIATLREESDRILSSAMPTSPPPGNDTFSFDTTKAPPSIPLPSPGGTSLGRWTKARVNSMVFADSAARETLRLHSFANRALMRKVMTHGVVTPDGQDLPKGTLISFLTYPVHVSAENHSDALQYDPFRFARLRKGASSPSTAATSPASPPITFVTTSADFLPFGHGRHACPGRFLIDFELKMVVSYILGNYDIRFPEEYGGKRPLNVWITEATFPPAGVRICLKRKTNA